MKRLSVLVVAVGLSFVGMLSVPALRAQNTVSGTRWEYLRLEVIHGPVFGARALRACQATASDWQCREFTPPQASDSVDQALREALSSLGLEGWELASMALAEGGNDPTTYLFKRPTK